MCEAMGAVKGVSDWAVVGGGSCRGCYECPLANLVVLRPPSLLCPILQPGCCCRTVVRAWGVGRGLRVRQGSWWGEG